MRRRNLVLVASALSLLTVGVLAAAAVLAVTNTGWGREWVRALVEAQLGPAVQGRIHVGRLTGGLLGGATIDSLEIRGQDDSLFVATGPISFTYDLRDLMDRRVFLRSVEVTRPKVVLKQFRDGSWNWRRIFPSRPRLVKATPRSFGDWIVVDTVTIRGGALRLTMPWNPADSLQGARRDSAVRFALDDRAHVVRRDADGLMKSWIWTEGFAAASHVRLAHPDTAGKLFVISRLDVTENDPPFRFREIRGTVVHHGDSVWLDLPHWRLPNTTGRSKGKVVWGSGLPMRYDLTLRSDSVCLADFGWIYPTLPREGCGRTDLHIGNKPGNLRVIEYALTNMEVRSVKSHLTGAMTFGVGGPVLEVTDVDLRADPVDFDLLRTFAGGPFPYDWQGTIRGTARGPGGPLNRFVVEESRFTYADKHVPGAVSSGRGRGMLDILFPAFTVFRGFTVEADRVDLRTIRHVNPEFAELNGWVSGTAVLDSIWTDVRFSKADLSHVDGEGTPSRFTGAGRVTLREEDVLYDVSLEAQPMNLTMLARSYPSMDPRGIVSGPIRARGRADSLDVTGTLSGVAGRVDFAGTADALLPAFGFRGEGTFRGLDLRQLFDDARFPTTALDGRVVTDISGDTIINYAGPVRIDLDRSRVAGVGLRTGRAHMTFLAGALRFDTLAADTELGTLSAVGGLGLDTGRSDSLRVRATVDSLGALRRWLAPPAPAGERTDEADLSLAIAGRPAPDSLSGTLRIEATLSGGVDRLDVAGTARGRGLVARGHRLHQFRLEGAVTDVVERPAGRVTLAADTALFGGYALRTLGLDVDLRGSDAARVALQGLADNGVALRAAADLLVRADTADGRLDSLVVRVDSATTWRLERPARFVAATGSVVVDTLALRGTDGTRIVAAAALPADSSVRLHLFTDSLRVGSLARLAQTTTALDGRIALALDAHGTRRAPVGTVAGRFSDASIGGDRLQYVELSGRYAERRMQTTLSLFHRGSPVLAGRAFLPLDLSLVPGVERLPDEPLSGSITADGANLEVLESFTTAVDSARGRLDVAIVVGGTWERPRLTGGVRVSEGAASLPALGDVGVNAISADLRLDGDNLQIRELAARSAPRRGQRIRSAADLVREGGTMRVTGGLGFADFDNPSLSLRLSARDFNILNRPGIADIDASGTLALEGTLDAARLSGRLEVDRGVIYIPDLATKRVISLDDPDFARVVDTALSRGPDVLPGARSRFGRNLQVPELFLSMGQDVWLRSAEANINLLGRLRVVRAGGAVDSAALPLTLRGKLFVGRGTYTLNLAEVVRRTFEVEPSSYIEFFETERTLNPALGISAVHTVRKFNQSLAQQERRIRVRVEGTLAQPQLAFESADNAQLSQSDLISYLITGAPAFGVGDPTQESGAVAAGVNAGISTATSVLSSVLGAQASRIGILDQVMVRTGGVGGEANQVDQGLGVLQSTRIGGGRQLTENTYLSGDVGLCPFIQTGNGPTDLKFSENLSLKLQYRISEAYSLAGGIEPSTRALICSGNTARGFVTTNFAQFGLDVLGTWRF